MKTIASALKHLIYIGLSLLAIFILRKQQIIEFSAAKFDIKDIRSNIVWYKMDASDGWYPLSESSSQMSFEEGLIDLMPDYKKKFSNLIMSHSGYNYQIEFPDGEMYSNLELKRNVCIYIKEYAQESKYLSPIRKKIKAQMSGVLDLDSFYNRDYNSEYYKGVIFETEMEITGIYSDAFLEFKLKEIWIQHLSDVLNFHLEPWEQKGRSRRHGPIQNAEL